MPSRFIRPLLVLEFLLAVQVWLTLWSEVGGQYHLDLMFWPWKFGLTVAAAALICAFTADLLRNEGSVSRRGVVYAALLVIVMVVAGVVTYYYHMNEPADDNGDEPSSQVTRLGGQVTRLGGQVTRLGGQVTRLGGQVTRLDTRSPTPSVFPPNS